MTTEAFTPKTLEEALELKSRFKGEVTIMAGGTDIMVSLKLGATTPARVMDITRIDDLKKIEISSGALFIGACATFSEIVESEEVREKAPVLHRASELVGARQVKNRATLGGNVATGSPAGDSLPALWVLDATVLLAGADGKRGVSFRKFYPGYRRSAIGEAEMITGFKVPVPRGAFAWDFYKVGARKAQAISKISLACMAKMKGKVFGDVRFSAGSVAPTVIGLERTAAYLEGKKAARSVVEKARRIAMEEVTPIDDVRSTALYRKTVAGNLVARFLDRFL